ncbi:MULTISPECIES: VOC family protein [unclassified Sphingomonas]|uniref:VOC family protein n=1 Tax=unclassified Sphingomonas TaxID=196159 RepID=UPI000829C81B|nr:MULTISPECIES: VOC family protein [unclassified Sphingomonas]
MIRARRSIRSASWRRGGDGRGQGHDRYAPGLHHLAWASDSREEVDRLHRLLVSIDAVILDQPMDYPRYGPRYYALFFADPDGLKLELVHFDPPVAR